MTDDGRLRSFDAGKGGRKDGNGLILYWGGISCSGSTQLYYLLKKRTSFKYSM